MNAAKVFRKVAPGLPFHFILERVAHLFLVVEKPVKKILLVG